MEEEKEFGAIDYDAPIESDKNTIGLGTKARLDLFFPSFLFSQYLWIHIWKRALNCMDITD